MLHDMLRGMHPDTAVNAEWRRGTLPPGRLGARKAAEIRDRARDLALVALRHRKFDGRAHDVDVDLGGGRRLTGTVAPVFGERTVSVTYSKLAPRHVLASWIGLVALVAEKPDGDWSALCIGRGTSKNRIAQRLFTAPPDPIAVLRDLVSLYDAGRREPLPLPLKTSYAWAEARRDGDDPHGAAEDKWRGTNFYPGEDENAPHVRVWGDHAPLQTLLGAPPPGEQTTGESTRLGALAARLWLPLLAAEGTPP
jgi:exodeoxyribonuclease V gamma subunit